MAKPIIHLYTLCYNEELMLPYFLRHYCQFVDQITIFDNYSDDSSESIAKQYKNVRIEKFDTNNKINDAVHLLIKNHCWKKSKGKADFVIVCDMDEFLYHPNICSFIERLKGLNFTIAKPFAFDMVHESLPKTQSQIYDEIKYGVRSTFYDKILIFDPNKINEINYSPGCHHCLPEGYVKLYKNDPEFKLLHYKNLDVGYLIKKNKQYSKRLSFTNKKMYWGFEYTFSQYKQRKKFKNMLRNKELVIK